MGYSVTSVPHTLEILTNYEAGFFCLKNILLVTSSEKNPHYSKCF